MERDVSTIAEEIRRTQAPITAGSTAAGVVFIERRFYDDLLGKAKILADHIAQTLETEKSS